MGAIDIHRVLHSIGRTIPIILLLPRESMFTPHVLQNLYKFRGVLPKPFTAQQLCDVIRHELITPPPVPTTPMVTTLPSHTTRPSIIHLRQASGITVQIREAYASRNDAEAAVTNNCVRRNHCYSNNIDVYSNNPNSFPEMESLEVSGESDLQSCDY